MTSWWAIGLANSWAISWVCPSNLPIGMSPCPLSHRLTTTRPAPMPPVSTSTDLARAMDVAASADAGSATRGLHWWWHGHWVCDAPCAGKTWPRLELWTNCWVLEDLHQHQSQWQWHTLVCEQVARENMDKGGLQPENSVILNNWKFVVFHYSVTRVTMHFGKQHRSIPFCLRHEPSITRFFWNYLLRFLCLFLFNDDSDSDDRWWSMMIDDDRHVSCRDGRCMWSNCADLVPPATGSKANNEFWWTIDPQRLG